jgi:sugar phosphate isomerase/epimerase
MVPISIQLYSVRDEVKGNFPALLKKIADMGYAGVEFAGFHGHSPSDLKKILDDLGMKASSVHSHFPDEKNLSEIVNAAQTLGYKWHGVGGVGSDSFTTEDLCRKEGARIQKAASMLKKEGLGFFLHNHWMEFDKKLNGKTPFDILMEEAPDLYAEIDTYWATLAGVNAAEVIGKYKNRIPILHIKDGPLVKEQAMTAVGEGKMNWKPIMDAPDKNMLKWIAVEIDRCDTDMMEAVEKSIKYLKKNNYGEGK